MNAELEERIINLEERVVLLEKEIITLKQTKKSSVGRPSKFTNEIKEQICTEFRNGKSVYCLSKEYHCAYNTISKIIKDNKEERDNMVIQVRKG